MSDMPLSSNDLYTMFLSPYILFKKLDSDPGPLWNSLSFTTTIHPKSKLCWEWGMEYYSRGCPVDK